MRDESLVNLPESARICGLTDAQLRKFWENDPTFPGPKPYTQLWRRWQIEEYRAKIESLTSTNRTRWRRAHAGDIPMDEFLKPRMASSFPSDTCQ